MMETKESSEATRYGFSLSDWQAAREDAVLILKGRAREQATISYSELAARLTRIHLEPDSHALAAMLGEISQEEDSFGNGMLSVLVVHKTGDMMPGAGFFELAHRLGKDVSDKDRLWIEEFRRVVEAHKG